MNFNIVYDVNCPNELVDYIDPLFKKFGVVVPKWVEDIYVSFVDSQNEEGSTADNISSVEYRRIYLRFYPSFLVERTDKLYIFVHELLHCIYSSVYQYSYNSIVSIVDDSKYQDLILEELRKNNEASTQDLTNLIFILMGIDKRTGKKVKYAK